MAKKAKGNRQQVILECTEHKESGTTGYFKIYYNKKQEEHS